MIYYTNSDTTPAVTVLPGCGIGAIIFGSFGCICGETCWDIIPCSIAGSGVGALVGAIIYSHNTNIVIQ